MYAWQDSGEGVPYGCTVGPTLVNSCLLPMPRTPRAYSSWATGGVRIHVHDAHSGLLWNHPHLNPAKHTWAKNILKASAKDQLTEPI